MSFRLGDGQRHSNTDEANHRSGSIAIVSGVSSPEGTQDEKNTREHVQVLNTIVLYDKHGLALVPQPSQFSDDPLVRYTRAWHRFLTSSYTLCPHA